ncbi:uncharacterized protein UV8b_00942 [Ustilaginoidea virens]|uniref:Inhibitor I9 domain-containing protein n=1 Tax=Ustilaginoidea virens TaxID=1159556 RepID=A0A8E5MET1_USTVR|nr:uncharacterized protein UV8b_00942 [Ustilaginoidea virens]QUC16701.1 hypothetical protein UV8b_00942 [Ustilaginoidea virens]
MARRPPVSVLRYFPPRINNLRSNLQRNLQSNLQSILQSNLQNHPIVDRFSTSSPAKMPSYIVSLKDDATDEQVKAAKQQAVEQGGVIGHEYTLFKGFSVTFDKDAITTLEANQDVKSVEVDGQVTTC